MNNQPKMLCERCQRPTENLRLVKYQILDPEQAKVITKRLWLCLQCWAQHGGKIEQVENDTRNL
jgi:hypothetical protein